MPRAYAETSAVFSIVLDRTGDLYYVIHKSIVGKDVKTMTETPGYLKNLKKESVVQSVINCLTDAMRNKELKPGDKIPPEPDLAAIDAINLEADIQTALENNYTYKKTTKQLANARTTTVHQTLEQTQKKQKETISNNVADSYSSLLLARSNYEQAQQALEIQRTAYESAGRKLQAGTITQKAYQTQQSSYLAAEVTVRTRKQSLLQAMVDYQWNVDGLASAS